MPSDYLKYTIDITPVTGNLQVDPGIKCNAITFLNKGAASVTIENLIVLQQGQSFVVDGNLGEIISGRYFNLAFTGADQNCIVIIKRYI